MTREDGTEQTRWAVAAPHTPIDQETGPTVQRSVEHLARHAFMDGPVLSRVSAVVECLRSGLARTVVHFPAHSLSVVVLRSLFCSECVAV
jgi:hypothetical protein